jgi:hypothetical protein
MDQDADARGSHENGLRQNAEVCSCGVSRRRHNMVNIALIGASGNLGREIKREDFAVAIVNEIETPEHHRRRITVGY